MAFESPDEADEVMSEINMTPLVDVMLVLLIIFIITVPVLKQAVPIDLPQASSQRLDEVPATLRLAVDAQGAYYLNDAAVSETQLVERLTGEAQRQPQPALQLRGDRAVRYEKVAQAMAMAQQAGLRQIAFVTEPVRR